MFERQSEVEKEDGKDRIVEAGIEQDAERYESTDIGQLKRCVRGRSSHVDESQEEIGSKGKAKSLARASLETVE